MTTPRTHTQFKVLRLLRAPCVFLFLKLLNASNHTSVPSQTLRWGAGTLCPAPPVSPPGWRGEIRNISLVILPEGVGQHSPSICFHPLLPALCFRLGLPTGSPGNSLERRRRVKWRCPPQVPTESQSSSQGGPFYMPLFPGVGTTLSLHPFSWQQPCFTCSGYTVPSPVVSADPAHASVGRSFSDLPGYPHLSVPSISSGGVEGGQERSKVRYMVLLEPAG